MNQNYINNIVIYVDGIKQQSKHDCHGRLYHMFQFCLHKVSTQLHGTQEALSFDDRSSSVL